MKGSVLIKFGKRNFLLQLQKEGVAFCNSIKWFANLSDENLRGDEFESVTRTHYMEKAIIQLREVGKPNSIWKNLNAENVLYKEYCKEPYGNLFCLSNFKFDLKSFNGIIKFEKEKFEKFGDSFLLILNQPEFFSRFKNGLNSANLEFCDGHVNYLDLKKRSGEKMLFQKDISYSYQHEYRIHIHSDHSDPIKINIGNIEDISILCNLNEFRGFEIKKHVINKISE